MTVPAARRPPRWARGRSLLWGLVLLAGAAAARAETAMVAVATNFAEVMQRLEADFEAASAHAVTVSTGSTGQLYAQIAHGAPYHVLLAADQQRPAALEQRGLAVSGSRFTYAIGRLVLWSPQPGLVEADGAATLRAGAFRRLAIANPVLAPYGAAARQVLERLDLYAPLRERIVMGENIGQTHALVATGNAELGFVAMASLQRPDQPAHGSRWAVPQQLHDPIRQDAVLLARGADNAAARDLLAYLRSPPARALIRRFGYGVD